MGDVMRCTITVPDKDFEVIDQYMKSKGYWNRSAFLTACAMEHIQSERLLPAVKSSFASVFGMLGQRLLGDALDDDLSRTIEDSKKELEQIQGQIDFQKYFDDNASGL